MVKFEDVFDMLKMTGYPVAYHHFNEPPGAIPYIVYYAEGYEPEYADNINYFNKIPLTVELYTKTKNLDAEASIEAALSNSGLPFSKTDVWIEEEQIYEIIYETEVF